MHDETVSRQPQDSYSPRCSQPMAQLSVETSSEGDSPPPARDASFGRRTSTNEGSPNDRDRRGSHIGELPVMGMPKLPRKAVDRPNSFTKKLTDMRRDSSGTGVRAGSPEARRGSSSNKDGGRRDSSKWSIVRSLVKPADALPGLDGSSNRLDLKAEKSGGQDRRRSRGRRNSHSKPAEKREDGLLYVGDRNAGGEPNGDGVMVFPGGDSYDGEWKDGVFEGKGVYHFGDGTEYSGRYLAGKRDGEGAERYMDGSSYEGQFYRGKREGKGCEYYPNGATFEGHYLRDVRDGPGMYYYADGEAEAGEYREGEDSGLAVRWNADRSRSWLSRDGVEVSDAEGNLTYLSRDEVAMVLMRLRLAEPVSLQHEHTPPALAPAATSPAASAGTTTKAMEQARETTDRNDSLL